MLQQISMATPTVVACTMACNTSWCCKNTPLCCNRGESIATPKKSVAQTYCYCISGNASQPNFCVAIFSIAALFGILQHF
jgi:hypothetical protein